MQPKNDDYGQNIPDLAHGLMFGDDVSEQGDDAYNIRDPESWTYHSIWHAC